METFSRLTRVFSRREPLRAGDAGGTYGPTNVLRLLDGAGDGSEFTGIFLDDFAGRWLLSTNDTAVRGAPRSLEWLRAAAPAPRTIYRKRLDQHDKRAPEHWSGEPVSGPFAVVENGLRYRVDFAAGYSQGIFLDQRHNRLAIREQCARLCRAGAPPPRVLNLFAYTCAFSVAAAAGGAHTASVDLSRVSLDWGRANFRLNGMDDAAHEFLAGDAGDFLRRFARRGRRFDLVVLDPPSFSRDRAGNVFRLARDLPELVRLAAHLLPADGSGALLVSTNLRALPPGGLRRLALGGLDDNRPDAWRTRTVGMPPDFPGDPYLQTVWLEHRD